MTSVDELLATTAQEVAERAVAEALLKFPVPATEYLNTPQAATYVNYSEEFLEIARHRADGSGPDYIKQSRAVRYKRSDLDRWMESRRVCNEPPPPVKTHRRAAPVIAHAKKWKPRRCVTNARGGLQCFAGLQSTYAETGKK
jgi:hypothetical protein